MRKHILFLLSVIVCQSCTQQPLTEKHQKNRDNIVHVQDRVVEVEIDDVLISAWAFIQFGYLDLTGIID